jgi:protein disulfide-isomerase
MKTGLILILAAAVLIPAANSRADGSDWFTDFEKAKAESAKRGVPILADFSGSDWCGWCMKLDREVFSQQDFLDFAKKNVVLFLADFPQNIKQPDELAQQNRNLMQTYKVAGFPTVLVLDKAGNVIGRTGYKAGGAKAYVQHIKDLIEKAKE